MTAPPTPRWWRALPSWSQVTVLSLLLPGVVAHELTHAIVASPWGEWALNWDAIAVEIQWTSPRPGPRAAAHIAPLVAGYAFAVGAVAAVLGFPSITIHAGLLAYVAVNWMYYTVASFSDVAVALAFARAWRRGEELPTADV